MTELQHSNDFGGNVHESRRFTQHKPSRACVLARCSNIPCFVHRPLTKLLLKQAMRLLDAGSSRDGAKTQAKTREHLISVASPRRATTAGVLAGLARPASSEGTLAYSISAVHRSNRNGFPMLAVDQRTAAATALPKTSFDGDLEKGSAKSSPSKGKGKKDSLGFEGSSKEESLLGDDYDSDDAEPLRPRLQSRSFEGAYGEEKQAALDALLAVAGRR